MAMNNNNNTKTKNDDNEETNDIESVSLKLSSLFSSIQNNFFNFNNNNNNNNINNNNNTNTTTVQDDETNKLAAQEICTVPATEREKILEEVHGIYCPNDIMMKKESDESIETSLFHLSQEINNIRKKPAYSRALFLAPHYVSNKQFLLMFLRADRFDYQKAARRVVKYFEVKLFLWGEDKLGKDITLDDFSEETMEYYRNGHSHFIPGGDSVGRPVLFFSYRHFETMKNYESYYQCGWYLFMSVLLNNENAQRMGLVMIFYSLDGPQNIPISLYNSIFNLHLIRDGLPLRLAALHICVDSAVQQHIVSVLRLALGKEWRLRFRIHYGTHLDCQNELMGFGISQKTFPVDENGTFKMAQFQMTLLQPRRYHREEEEEEEEERQQPHDPSQHTTNYVAGTSDDSTTTTTTSSETLSNILQSTICATDKDVLLGRGKPFQSHPGNLELNTLIEQKLDELSNTPKQHQKQQQQQEESINSDQDHPIKKSKADIMLEIFHQVQARGGRFLQRVTVPSTVPSTTTTTTTTSSSSISSNNGIMIQERWIEATTADATTKIYNSFRQRQQTRSTQKKSTASSSTTSRMMTKKDNNFTLKNDSFQEKLRISEIGHHHHKGAYYPNDGSNDGNDEGCKENENDDDDDDERDLMPDGKNEKRHRYR